MDETKLINSAVNIGLETGAAYAEMFAGMCENDSNTKQEMIDKFLTLASFIRALKKEVN